MLSIKSSDLALGEEAGSPIQGWLTDRQLPTMSTTY